MLPGKSTLKAKKPLEILTIEFNGPGPTLSQNNHMLAVIDEFSKFAFEFVYPDVISCLDLLFSISGMPAFIHLYK